MSRSRSAFKAAAIEVCLNGFNIINGLLGCGKLEARKPICRPRTPERPLCQYIVVGAAWPLYATD